MLSDGLLSLAEAAKAFRSGRVALQSAPSSEPREEGDMRTLAEAAKTAAMTSAAVKEREKELPGCLYGGGVSLGESPSVSLIACTR